MKNKINNFKLGFYLNKHHRLKSNKNFFKLKLRVYSCLEGKTKMYVLKNFVISLKDWHEINDVKKVSKNNSQIKSIIDNFKNLAINVCLRDDVNFLNDFDKIWKNTDNRALNFIKP